MKSSLSTPPSLPADGGEGWGEEARLNWDFPSPRSSPPSCVAERGRSNPRVLPVALLCLTLAFAKLLEVQAVESSKTNEVVAEADQTIPGESLPTEPVESSSTRIETVEG